MPKQHSFICPICGTNYRGKNGKYCSTSCKALASVGRVWSPETIKKRSDSMKAREIIPRWTTINESVFNDPITPEAAYWVGFLMADGYITPGNGHYAIKLCIQGRDREINESFRDFVGSNAEIHTDKLGRSCVGIWSRGLVRAVSRFGLINRKTGKEDFVNVPRELARHFIRGYFDGDGCVCVCNKKYGYLSVRFCSASMSFMEKLGDIIFSDIGVKSGKIYSPPNKHCHYLTYTGRNNIVKLYGYLYNGVNLFLKRKKNTFDETFYIWPRPAVDFIEAMEW